eukprot:5212153-Prymnesium_polylepis.1
MSGSRGVRTSLAVVAATLTEARLHDDRRRALGTLARGELGSGAAAVEVGGRAHAGQCSAAGNAAAGRSDRMASHSAWMALQRAGERHACV